MAAVILANGAIVIAGLLDTGFERLLGVAEHGCVLFFAGELAIRIRATGWRFFAGSWNLFDLLVILLAVVPVFGSVNTSLMRLVRLGRLARMVHLGRHTVHLSQHVHGLPLRRLVRFDPVLLVGAAAAVGAVFAGGALLGI